jgi:hypothetical protein
MKVQICFSVFLILYAYSENTLKVIYCTIVGDYDILH